MVNGEIEMISEPLDDNTEQIDDEELADEIISDHEETITKDDVKDEPTNGVLEIVNEFSTSLLKFNNVIFRMLTTLTMK